MSNDNTIINNLTTDDADAKISSAIHNIASTMTEVVTAELNTNVDSAEEVTAALLLEPTTKNGLLIELQNMLAIACYKSVDKKDMKVDQIIEKMHGKLFSSST